MARTDTRGRIIRHLRSTDKPALSAANLADELDVSVRTVNTHLEDLLKEDKVQTHKIGNAMAYYLKESDIPPHKKPNHYCKRCGRAIDHLYDYAKVETQTYYEDQSRESSMADFFIFCRFCYSDFISWVHNDPQMMGDYSFVDKWNIPEEQKQVVKNDPEITTSPPED